MIDPRYLDVQEWCNLMVQNLAPLVNAPRLLDPKEWKVWANSVVSSPQVRVSHPPDPAFFDDWREWAFRFNQAVNV